MDTKVLFLDDDPNRHEKFLKLCPHAQVAWTAKECIDLLYDEEYWDEVYLDHDLDGEVYVDSESENCGMEVVRHLEHIHSLQEGDRQHQCGMSPPSINRIICHSLNHPAALSMVERLEKLGYNVDRIPFMKGYFY